MLTELVEIESKNRQLLSPQFSNGVPFWLVCRYYLFRGLLYRSTGVSLNTPPISKTHQRMRGVLKGLSIAELPWFLPKSDFLFFSFDRWTIADPEKSVFVNRVVDTLVEQTNGSTLVVDMSSNTYKRPRSIGRIVRDKSFRIRTSLLSKLGIGRDKDALPQIAPFVTELARVFCLPSDDPLLEEVTKTLQRLSKTLLIDYKNYFRLFSRVKPRVVFVPLGLYGIEAAIVSAANASGCVTVELQHGVIYKNHPAYIHPDIEEYRSRMSMYMPQWFLTYGEWWKTQIKVPSKCFVLGCPYLENEKRRMISVKESKKRLLIISQPGLSDQLVDLANTMSARLGIEWVVSVRLHPKERVWKEQFLQRIQGSSIELDGGEHSIYRELSRSSAVVGSASTVLFEAAAFSKPVYILQTALSAIGPYLKVGTPFGSVEELVQSLSSPLKSKGDIEEVWEPDWERSWQEFLVRVGMTEKEDYQ